MAEIDLTSPFSYGMPGSSYAERQAAGGISLAEYNNNPGNIMYHTVYPEKKRGKGWTEENPIMIDHPKAGQIVMGSDGKGTNCPYCAGKKIDETNSLETLYPSIAKEWHPTKNKDLTPKQVAAKSLNYAWWLCSKGHSFEAKIHNRTRWKDSKVVYALQLKGIKWQELKEV